MNVLRVQVVMMDDGERFPVLLASDGVPLFRPTVWAVAMRRATNVATATILSDLVALKLLYLWADDEKIPLDERMLGGRYLSTVELSSLVRRAQYRLDRVADTSEQGATGPRFAFLERCRQRNATAKQEVNLQTAAARLHTIISYLRWLTEEGLSVTPPKVIEERIVARDGMLKGLNARIPKTKGRNVVGQREGPPAEVMNRILSVIEPDADENPWDDPALRIRNRLLVHVIYGLGLRRGEALGIKVTNVDFRQNRLLIARAADDPEDPRRHQPLTKTRDRWLPLKDSLAGMMQEYITHTRRKFLRARRHPFLFVSHQDGAPLALVSANKIFRTLRKKVPGLPDNLSPHLLRHAWNDAFSAIADGRRTEQAEEEKLRSYLMGWSPSSSTASTYTRRHVRSKADELSLRHQAALLKINPDAI